MNVRPILFSPEMIRALLEGRKTQTRRIVKSPRWSWVADDRIVVASDRVPRALCYKNDVDPPTHDWREIPCPYGKPGDLLWVRETFGIPDAPYERKRRELVAYKATDYPATDFGRWRSARFMPRWASRLTLKITEVRVQRVQEISEDDAKAEGALMDYDGPYSFHQGFSYRGGFMSLWESLHGHGSWDANPWVWAITFEVIAQNVDTYIASRAMAGPRDPRPTEHFIEKEPTGV